MTNVDETVKGLRQRYSLDPTIQKASDLIENLNSDCLHTQERLDKTTAALDMLSVALWNIMFKSEEEGIRQIASDALRHGTNKEAK